MINQLSSVYTWQYAFFQKPLDLSEGVYHPLGPFCPSGW